jgi:hypothetical protein
MSKRSTDQSVFNEPHLRAPPPPPPADGVIPYAGPDTPDAREIDVNQDVRFEPTYAAAREPTVEHSVWNEPGVSRDQARVAAVNPAQVTYARWLEAGCARWSPLKSWGLTLLVALAAGPWAVLGALMNGGQSISGALMLVFFGPVTEELMKIAGVTLVIEKWPYALRGAAQIVICSVAGGLAFAAIENLLYFYVYVPSPTHKLIVWRWTACVALHTVCSFIAGLGAVRVWRNVWRTHSPPKLSLALPFIIAASVTHGLYNATALVLELTGVLTWQ